MFLRRHNTGPVRVHHNGPNNNLAMPPRLDEDD